MPAPSMVRVIREGVWLYLRSVVTSLAGLFYWMIISAVGGAEVVGLSSATYALASIVTGTLSLGEEVGVRRFLGVCIGRGDREGVASYFWSTALFRAVTFIPAGLAMAVLGLLGLSIGGLSSDLVKCFSTQES